MKIYVGLNGRQGISKGGMKTIKDWVVLINIVGLKKRPSNNSVNIVNRFALYPKPYRGLFHSI